MTYRKLQAILKVARNKGLLPRSFKLNQKKFILFAAYKRLVRTGAKWMPTPAPLTTISDPFTVQDAISAGGILRTRMIANIAQVAMYRGYNGGYAGRGYAAAYAFDFIDYIRQVGFTAAYDQYIRPLTRKYV